MHKVIRLSSAVVVASLAFASVASSGASVHAQAAPILVDGGSSGQAETDSLNAIVAGWNKLHPDTPAKFIADPDVTTTINKGLASGNPPDIFYVDSSIFLNLVASNALAPIGDKIDNPTDFIPALRDVFTANGKFYCPPKDFSTLALQTNDAMLAAAGIKAPPTTWDELAADAKLLTKGDVVGFMTPNDPARWLAWLYQAGGSLTNADFTKMTVNSPEGLAAFKYWTDLYASGYAKKASDVGSNWPGEAFEKGKVAMIAEGNWLLGDVAKNAPNLKYTSSPLPTGPKGQASMVFTVCYGVAAAGKHVDVATQLVNYMVSTESMTKFTNDVGVMPARQSLRDAWLASHPNLKVYLDAAAYAHRWGFGPGFQPVLDDITKQLDLTFQQQETAADALAEIEKTGNGILAGNGSSATKAATMAGTMSSAATMAATMSSAATMAPTMAATK